MQHWSRFLAVCGLIVTGISALAQQPVPSPAVAEVRQTIDAARKATDTYKAGGGSPGTADHPAIKWDETLWEYRTRYAGTEASALAAVEAVRLLVRAELWDRAHARIAAIDPDDRAWERLATPVYDEGIARKDLQYTIDTLSKIAASTTKPANKAASLLIIGRAHRRAGDTAAATAALEAAKAASPGSLLAEEAEGVLYEIKFLSPGMPAPAVSGRTRNTRGTVDLASFRGRPVVLVFWGST